MFQTPDDQRYVMGRPPLVRAVVELSYSFSSQLARVLTDEGLVDLQSRLSDQFPFVEPVRSGVASVGAPSDERKSRFAFQSPDGYELVVSAENATLSIDHRYTNRESFQGKLLPAAQALGEVGQLKAIRRLGARYVNAEAASLDEWTTWFKPEFVGWVNAPFVQPHEQRVSLHVVQIATGDNNDPMTATIRYGYLPGGVGPDVTSKDPKNKPSFLADIDVAYEKAFAYDTTEIASKFRMVTNEIARFFLYSLSEKGREHFEVRPAEVAVS